MTNYEMIKSMTIYELLGFMSSIYHEGYRDGYNDRYGGSLCSTIRNIDWLKVDWLKKEIAEH